MAKQTRSSVLAIREETTEATLISPSSASQFTALRQGFSFESGVETIDTDELVNDIGAAEGFVGKQTPKGSVPKYFKHSGVEGQAPDYSLLIKSAIGSVTTHGTEYTLVSSSTAGSSSAAPVLKGDTGTGAASEVGMAVLVKDGANGYAIRNVASIASDDLTLNFNLAGAPASGVALGKAVHYVPVATGHPTFSAHLYQAAASTSAIHQAMSGCRTTQMQMDFPANQLATISFDFEGVNFYVNPITIDSTNNKIDGNLDGSGTDFTATLTSKAYKTPHDLASEVATKLTAAAGATITCTYSNTTGKFTIAKESGTLQLLWNSGTNTATGAHTTLGFSAASDSTGGLTYTSANAQTYGAAYTPSYDSSSANVVRYNELLIGNFARTDLRKASNVSFTVATPRTEVEDLTAETGIESSVVLERTVTMSATLILQAHEVQEFDAMINNTGVSVMFNHGAKNGAGNWQAGKCVNVWIPQAKITKNVVSDKDGIQVVEIEAKAYVTSSSKDFHLNFV